MKMPKTITDWELFQEKGAGEASRALTKALQKIEKLIKATPAEMIYKSGGIHEVIYLMMEEHMYPVMDKYDDFGAYDSEPRGKAMEYLFQKFKK